MWFWIWRFKLLTNANEKKTTLESCGEAEQGLYIFVKGRETEHLLKNLEI